MMNRFKLSWRELWKATASTINICKFSRLEVSILKWKKSKAREKGRKNRLAKNPLQNKVRWKTPNIPKKLQSETKIQYIDHHTQNATLPRTQTP